MFGLAITTSSITVGSRCTFAHAQTGAVLTQHRTDPRLGPLGLKLLAAGCTARDTVSALIACTPFRDWRQIGVIDREGHTAQFSGSKNGPICASAEKQDCIAIGNILRTHNVTEAMTAAFVRLSDSPLADRLLAALAAGDEAGGEVKLLRSAALLVVHQQSFPYVDLRIDSDDRPIKALQSLWEEYAPLADTYVARALDPERI